MKINNVRENYRVTVAQIVLSMETGGMETVIANILRNIDRKLYRVIVVCINRIGEIGRELQAEDIKIIRRPLMPGKSSFVYPGTLIRTLKREGVDIVHTHSGCWHKALIAAKLSSVKGTIYTEHGRFAPDPLSRVIHDRVISSLTDYVVPVSPDLEEYMRNTLKIPSRKIHRIENGIDTAYFGPSPKGISILNELNISENCFVVGNIARLRPVKDHKTLLHSFGIALKSCPDMKLILVGDGPDKSNIERLIHELNLTEDVMLLGLRRDIQELLSVFDVFVLSSLSEGTSMTILEAMTAGKPVIATNVGGNSNLVIDGETGFLVKPGNPPELAEKLLLLQRDEAIRSNMGVKASERVKDKFEAQVMTRKYEALYSRLATIK
ncbi:MAG: glycosyltransferase [Thermodesulfobacteriota bacterium]|nr:glycosyltransferase [Thermodesulfobacteriota bacterium]